MADRKDKLYFSDLEGTSDESAIQSYEWALKHGDRYRIAYACHENDFPVPDGWRSHIMEFSGRNPHTAKQKKEREKKPKPRDMLMFSPACIGQTDLFV